MKLFITDEECTHFKQTILFAKSNLLIKYSNELTTLLKSIITS